MVITVISTRTYHVALKLYFFQVLLQTYIEYLRGKVEDIKEVTLNHHGKVK